MTKKTRAGDVKTRERSCPLQDPLHSCTPAARYHQLCGIIKMIHIPILLSMVAVIQATMYMPPIKDHAFTDMQLLHELVERMGNELVEAADSYLELQGGSRLPNEYERAKEIPAEIPSDYDGIDTLNPNPSIRDQEYLQHSSLWSRQRVDNANEHNKYRIQAGRLKGIKDEKTENSLPAYCTPPNPCPIGYTHENNCIDDFENTAAFSRDYQSSQDCMCDTEHMLDCSNAAENNSGLSNMRISNSDFNQIVEQFQEDNPFFRGEKLPIAAKKGINVIY